MSDIESYDIIVIGAGPAGANFARLVDSRCYRVLLVDGSSGHEKVCGGLLSPDAQDVLARYNISVPKDVLADPQLFSVKTVDLCDGYTRYYRRSYMNVNRRKFDELILSLVPNSVRRVSGRCVSVSREGKDFSLEIAVSGTNETQAYRCKYLVGADGASSIVRRSLFQNKKIYRYTAIQQQFEASESEPFYSCIFDNDTSSGCSWIFFKDGRLIFGGAFEAYGSRKAFEEQKRKLIDLGVVQKEAFDFPVALDACQVLRPKLSGGVALSKDNAFLLGEAAGFISPSSFEGISYALLSAEALADAFNREKGKGASIERAYKRATLALRAKIALKCVKRPFMYDSTLRRAVMKSGLMTIKMRER